MNEMVKCGLDGTSKLVEQLFPTSAIKQAPIMEGVTEFFRVLCCSTFLIKSSNCLTCGYTLLVAIFILREELGRGEWVYKVWLRVIV